MKFTHLHNHTQFSLLDGASSIPKLYKKAEKDGMPAIAITDHGNMFGAFQFVAQAWKNTKVVGKDENGKDILEPVVKPIVGCEFYLVENRLQQSFTKLKKDKRHHQLFLAKDELGYKNLVKLCSLGFMEGMYGKYPRIDKELVLKYHEGLIATTCCIGAEVPQAILKKTPQEAEEIFKWWLDLFGDDYYVELQRHQIPDQIKVNEVLLQYAKKYNVPIIASNDSHYVDQEDFNAHDILLCINTGEKQSTPVIKEFSDDNEIREKNSRFGFYNDQFYFKKTEEMSRLFSDIPQSIENTQMIVDKIKPLKLHREILLPHFDVPAEFNDDQNAYLEHLTWMGAKERYQEITAEVEERINFEMFTIRTMGFAGYFLIVADFIKAGRDLGVFIGPGRGSAAGSVVAYCTGITNIDPIKYNLLFERFLNPDRKSMPDIDTDFDDAGRQKVIDYVVEKYGRNQVAQIVTYGTMAAKSSIKDVARVMDLPLDQSNALTKLIPDKPGISLTRVLRAPLDASTKEVKSLKDKEGLGEEEFVKIRELRALLEAEGTLTSTVLKEAEKLEGSVRNVGIHAAGLIIAPRDLSELIPVSTVKDSQLLVTQFDGKVIEDAGVIKMDFLGLKTLTILKDALHLIKRNHGIDIDIDKIPLDDEATYALYQKGDTNATFQFESVGMQKYLRELKPDKFADLIAMNALYRPGPIKYIPSFIKRKNKEEDITYDIPEMEEYLADTYGITVYQEQVMLLSQSIGGFSKGDADVLRKAMGKKQIDVLNKMKVQFIEGAKEKGHPEDKLKKIWTDWEAFAQYAFNKSHSTGYALVAYQTAYLKAHYPSEFMAAVMNSAATIDKITFFMEECQRMDLNVLGPDVNESIKGFSVNKNGIVRFGLGAIKGVGDAAVEELILEREKNGNYASIFDMIMRVNQRAVNKKSIESLALAGAFDCFPEYHRAQYFYVSPSDQISGIERIVRFGAQYQAAASFAENSLFGDTEMPAIQHPDLPKCTPWTLHELLEKEKETIGIYLSGHPLDGYKFEIKNYNIVEIKNIDKYIGKQIRIAGFVANPMIGFTKKGDKYGKMMLTDYTGSFELNLWKDTFVKYGDYVSESQSIMVTGTYNNHPYRPDQMEFRIDHIMLLGDVKAKFTKKMTIFLKLEQVTMPLIQFLSTNLKQNPGKCELVLSIIDKMDNKTTLKAGAAKLWLNDDLIQYLGQTGIATHIELI